MNKEQEKFLDQQVEKVAGKENKQTNSAMTNVLGDVLFKGLSIMQAIGFPPGLIEMMYSFASDLYSSGKYEDARAMFFFITQLNPKDKRFPFGCAASHHKVKKYYEASNYYLMASSLDPADPYPYFHAADCYIQLGKFENAKFLLDSCLVAAGERPEHEKLRQQVVAMQHIILQGMGASEKEKVEQR